LRKKEKRRGKKVSSITRRGKRPKQFRVQEGGVDIHVPSPPAELEGKNKTGKAVAPVVGKGERKKKKVPHELWGEGQIV